MCGDQIRVKVQVGRECRMLSVYPARKFLKQQWGIFCDVDLMGQCLLENVANFSSSYISTATGCKEKRKKIARLQVHIYRRTHRGVKLDAGKLRAVLPAPSCVKPRRDPLACYWNVTRMRSGALEKEGECRSTRECAHP